MRKYEMVKCEILKIAIYLEDDESLIWYCRKCVVICKNFMKLMSIVQETQQRMEERIDEMSSSTEKKMTEIMKTVDVKIADLCQQVEKSRHVGEGDEADEQPQQRIEAKVDALMESVSAGKINSHLVHDCVEDAILVRIAEDQEEAEEVRKRRSNIVVFGVPESTESDYDRRRAEDEDHLQNIFHEIKCDSTTVNRVIRMGKRPVQENDKPRPMLVTMASEGQKDQVLVRSKNLKRSGREGMDKVFIFQDLTPRQRDKRKKLVQELKDRQQSGEKDLVIAGGKIVCRGGIKNMKQ